MSSERIISTPHTLMVVMLRSLQKHLLIVCTCTEPTIVTAVLFFRYWL
jgi:hypothetical protein